jgi:hypothetical protein
MNIDAGHYYIPDTPRENGYLLIEVTKDGQVQVVSPASRWWRDRVFATVEEFRQVWLKEYMFRDRALLEHPMGQFQNYYSRLFVHQGEELGWRYIKKVK